MNPYRSRRSVLNALQHKPSDRIPFTPPFKEWLDEGTVRGMPDDMRECYLHGDFHTVRFRVDQERNRSRFSSLFPAGIPGNGIVSDWGFVDIPQRTDAGYHAGNKTLHTLADAASLADIESYPWPDMAEPDRHAHINDEVAEKKRDEFVVIGQMSQTFLETAYLMRGMENLFCDFYANPDIVGGIFKRLRPERIFQAETFARAGVDVLRIGDDIASQTGLIVGKDIYREFIKPYQREVIRAARAIHPDIIVLYHSDGLLEPLFDDLIEIGVNAVNPVQPECMDLREIKKSYGDRLVLWGCMAVQSTFEFGTDEYILRDIRLVKEISQDGGICIDFINMVPTANVRRNLVSFAKHFYPLSRAAFAQAH